MPSTQVAPFRQGLEWHSSVSARNEGLPLGLWAGNPTKRRTRFLACLGRTRCSGGTWEVSGSYLEAYCHCCCWRDEGKRPDHPTRRTLFWCHLMAERRSGDIKTPQQDVYPTQHSASLIAMVTSHCLPSLPEGWNMQTCGCLHQLCAYQEECGLPKSGKNVLK